MCLLYGKYRPMRNEPQTGAVTALACRISEPVAVRQCDVTFSELDDNLMTYFISKISQYRVEQTGKLVVVNTSWFCLAATGSLPELVEVLFATV